MDQRKNPHTASSVVKIEGKHDIIWQAKSIKFDPIRDAGCTGGGGGGGLSGVYYCQILQINYTSLENDFYQIREDSNQF